jgi:tetratricopeptide (TPR) repeat protein
MQTIWNHLLPWLSLALLVATLAWFLYRSLRRSDEPTRLAWRWVISAGLIVGTLLFLTKGLGLGDTGSLLGNYGKAFLIAGTAATCGLLLGILWAGSIGTWLARPLVALFDGGSQEIQPEPCYSAVTRHRMRGESNEAIQEVHRQLDAFPGDLTGTLLLAEIQAQDLHDPHAAIQTLESWMQIWGPSSSRAPATLHRIADLQLRHHQDPSSARAALERIVKTSPNTEAAHLAAQRIAHLASKEMLAEKTAPHRIRIGQYPTHPGWQPCRGGETNPSIDLAADPSAAIAECTRHLEQFPEDDEARERLARLYAERDGNMKRAQPELERLIAQSGATHRQVARWLNLMVDLQLHVAGDDAAARATLQRIIERSPQSASAEKARHRLALIKLELRRKDTPRSFPLGLGGHRNG